MVDMLFGTIATTTAIQKADEAFEKSLPFSAMSAFRPMTAAYCISISFATERSDSLA